MYYIQLYLCEYDCGFIRLITPVPNAYERVCVRAVCSIPKLATVAI